MFMTNTSTENQRFTLKSLKLRWSISTSQLEPPFFSKEYVRTFLCNLNVSKTKLDEKMGLVQTYTISITIIIQPTQ